MPDKIRKVKKPAILRTSRSDRVREMESLAEEMEKMSEVFSRVAGVLHAKKDELQIDQDLYEEFIALQRRKK